MSRDPIPLYAEDISEFAKALGRQLEDSGAPVKHLALMNMLARAGGFQNYQHLRKLHAAAAPEAGREAVQPADHKLVERALRLFDARGQLTFWHSKRSVQDLCTWALWAAVPPERLMSEREISAVLDGLHEFGDAAVIRRRMITLGLMQRERDGSNYLRLEQAPPEEARLLMRKVSTRRKAA